MKSPMGLVAWQALLGLLSWYFVMWSSISFKDTPSVVEFYGCPTQNRAPDAFWDSSLSNGHKGDVPYNCSKISRGEVQEKIS